MKWLDVLLGKRYRGHRADDVATVERESAEGVDRALRVLPTHRAERLAKALRELNDGLHEVRGKG